MILAIGILMGMLIGAACLAIGYGVGYRGRSNELPPRPVSAFKVLPMGDCTCGHAQSFHYNGEGSCRKEWWDKNANNDYTCDCCVYVPANPPTTPLLEAMKELEGF